MASRKTSEIAQLQQEIVKEIESDAPEIAMMVFGAPRDQPDVVTVSNDRLDRSYRDAYLRNDRVWLQGEARRDPEQFLKVADRIGVVIPPELPGIKPLEFGAFAKAAAKPQLPAPPVAAAPVMPVVPPPVIAPVASPAPPAPVAAPPILLGPNGQPLPPSMPPQVM